MADHSSIEWTDATWNPTRGCSRISEGCRNCYAERIAARMSKPGMWADGFARVTPAGPRWTGRVELVPHMLDLPLRWRRPRRIFVNSTSDLFHEALPDEAIAAVFGAMAAASQHTYQILTKRADRLPRWFAWYEADHNTQRYRHPELIEHAAATVVQHVFKADPARRQLVADRLFKAANDRAGHNAWPLPNVWLGVSVEDQATADERIPLLLQTPAAVRWVSYEPALGPVDFSRWLGGDAIAGHCVDIDGERWHEPGRCAGGINNCSGRCCSRGLDWIVVGGESGPGARPFDLAWARSTVEQCKAAGEPVFVKQMGHWIQGDHEGLVVDRWLLEGGRVFVPPVLGPTALSRPAGAVAFTLGDKGGDMAQWPADLRLRQLPGGAA